MARYLYQNAMHFSENKELWKNYLQRAESAYLKKLERGQAAMENFNDESHLECKACHLRFKSKKRDCPFCGAVVERAPKDNASFKMNLFLQIIEQNIALRGYAPKDGLIHE